jgi:hypothetical protein
MMDALSSNPSTAKIKQQKAPEGALFFFFFDVLRIELSTSHLPGKHTAA